MRGEAGCGPGIGEGQDLPSQENDVFRYLEEDTPNLISAHKNTLQMYWSKE